MPITEAELRALYGETSPRAARKVIDRFDHHCRAFIEAAPFAVLATSDGTQLDASPKGDPAGFVHIESERTLLLPDRPGNNRLDGLLNILRHPNVALIFLIPTVGETLRVNGTAEILTDEAICARFAVKGRAPKTVTRITADEIYTHCGKAPMRAGLWKPETWPKVRPVPPLYEMVRDHAAMEVELLDQEETEARYRDTLY